VYFTLAVSAATAARCAALAGAARDADRRVMPIPGPARVAWRARFLRGYVLDHGEAGPVFGIVSRRAAERCLAAPLADPQAAWALATLAALLSGDWLSAREPAARTASSGR
jgi:hypothetical protein